MFLEPVFFRLTRFNIIFLIELNFLLYLHRIFHLDWNYYVIWLSWSEQHLFILAGVVKQKNAYKKTDEAMAIKFQLVADELFSGKYSIFPPHLKIQGPAVNRKFLRL